MCCRPARRGERRKTAVRNEYYCGRRIPEKVNVRAHKLVQDGCATIVRQLIAMSALRMLALYAAC